MHTLSIHKKTDGITFIHITTLNFETIAYWGEVKDQLYQNARTNGEHLRLLLDIREAGYPHAEATQQLFRQTHHNPPHRSIAILTAPFALGLTERALYQMPRQSSRNARIFLTETDALRWLDERLRNAH